MIQTSAKFKRKFTGAFEKRSVEKVLRKVGGNLLFGVVLWTATRIS